MSFRSIIGSEPPGSAWILACALLLFACGENAPLEPDETKSESDPNSVVETDFDMEGLPEIPRPVSLSDIGAQRSEVLTVVRRLDGDFNPAFTDINAEWEILASRLGLGADVVTAPCPSAVFRGPARSTELQSDSPHACAMQRNLVFLTLGFTGTMPAGASLVPDAALRHLIWQDGARRPASVMALTDTLIRTGNCGGFGFCSLRDEVTYLVRLPEITEDVHVRRDRFWERRRLLDGSEMFILEGPITRTLGFSYSSGSTATETEEFGRSLTVEVGASGFGFSASVSATLSQTFTTSLEVRRDTTITVEEEFSGEPGLARVMTLWVLVDRYSFTDAAGNTYSDANFGIVPLEFTDQGRIVALLATDFDL